MLRTAWPSLTLDKDGKHRIHGCYGYGVSHGYNLVIEMNTATQLAGEFQVGDPIHVEKYTSSDPTTRIATRVTIRLLATPDFTLNPTLTCYIQESLCK